MELKGQILIYSESGCKECMNIKTKLESLLLPYVEVDLVNHPDRRIEMENLTDRDTVPQIFFNDHHIGGYYDLIDLETSGQLDSIIDQVKNTPIPDTAPKPAEHSPNCTGEIVGWNRIKLESLLVKLADQGVLSSHRKMFTVYHSSFHGKDLIAWLTSQEMLSYQDALNTAGDLVKEGLVVHVTDPGHPFADSSQLFKVVGADFPSALNSGITQSCGDQSAVQISENLRKIMTSLSGRHISEEGYKVNYEGIKTDVEFAKYVITAQSLQRVSLAGMSKQELIAMFINIYNALVVHGIVSRGAPTNHYVRYKFFKNVSYVIAGHNYSLNEIENGVLRANRKGMADLSKPFPAGDPRLSVALESPEPRVHFALNCASKGCPPIRFYSPDKLDNQLNKATKSFLSAGGFSVNSDTHQVSLSPILKWYKADFGKSDAEMLKWVCGFVNNADESRVLQELIDTKQFKIVWQDYDWSLNH